jgi:hypothetical protein
LLKEKQRLEKEDDETEQDKFKVPVIRERKFSVQSVNSNHNLQFGSEYSPGEKF